MCGLWLLAFRFGLGFAGTCFGGVADRLLWFDCAFVGCWIALLWV